MQSIRFFNETESVIVAKVIPSEGDPIGITMSMQLEPGEVGAVEAKDRGVTISIASR